MSKTDTPVVIGAVVGALVLLFVIAGVIFYLIRRKKAGAAPDEASSAQTSEMMTVIYDYSPNLFDEIHLCKNHFFWGGLTFKRAINDSSKPNLFE